MHKQLKLSFPIIISKAESTLGCASHHRVCRVDSSSAGFSGLAGSLRLVVMRVRSIRLDLMCSSALSCIKWSSPAVNWCVHPALFSLCALTVVLILLFCLFAALFIYLLFPCFLSVSLLLFPHSSAWLCQGLGKSFVWQLVNVRDPLTLVLCLISVILLLTTLPFIAVAQLKSLPFLLLLFKDHVLSHWCLPMNSCLPEWCWVNECCKHSNNVQALISWIF